MSAIASARNMVDLMTRLCSFGAVFNGFSLEYHIGTPCSIGVELVKSSSSSKPALNALLPKGWLGGPYSDIACPIIVAVVLMKEGLTHRIETMQYDSLPGRLGLDPENVQRMMVGWGHRLSGRY